MDKVCSDCGLLKPLVDYPKRYECNSLRPFCKKCSWLRRKPQKSKYSKEYYQQNKEIIRERKRLWDINKRQTDIHFKIRKNLRRRINLVLHGKKSARTLILLGCNVESLKHWLSYQFEEGMSWNNYGRNGWHIDHVKPCAAFDLTDPDEQKKCFHWTNLQPLWAKDNLSKGAKHV